MRLAMGEPPGCDDSLTLTQVESSIVVLTTSRPLKGVKSYESLTWDQVPKARTILLMHARNEQWEELMLERLSLFFIKLDTHPIRSEPKGNDVVLRYQATYRKQWHRAILKGEPFDITEIDEVALAKIRGDLLTEHTVRALHSVSRSSLPQRS